MPQRDALPPVGRGRVGGCSRGASPDSRRASWPGPNHVALRPRVMLYLGPMDRRHFLKSLTSGMLASRLSGQPETKPNIVLIYADDVGYGDLSCYGATRVRTPNLDRLAGAGVRFTNAHSSSATCTPSRYSLLTGEYAWRKRGTNVLPGDANLVIEPDRGTLPAMLRDRGYRTAVVGKWHLGMGKGKVDWNAEIRPGPREVGFDYSFIMPATGDRVPC